VTVRGDNVRTEKMRQGEKEMYPGVRRGLGWKGNVLGSVHKLNEYGYVTKSFRKGCHRRLFRRIGKTTV